LAEYQWTVKLDPQRFEAYNNIGRLLSDAGKPAEALEYCRTAVGLNPGLSASHNGLGVVLAELGRYQEALGEFTEAGRLDERSAAPHFQGGRVLLKLGRGADARQQFEEALRRDPNDLGMLIYVARALAAAPNQELRDGAAALVLARRAAELAGSRQPVVLDTLAMACAETGRFDDAVSWGRRAVAEAAAVGSRADAADMQQRLAQYEQHQPARVPAP
jgi:tetratricopeptide (TPR) repeat protein